MSLRDAFHRGRHDAATRFKVSNALMGYGPAAAAPATSTAAAPPMSGAATGAAGRTPSLAAPMAPQGAKASVL